MRQWLDGTELVRMLTSEPATSTPMVPTTMRWIHCLASKADFASAEVTLQRKAKMNASGKIVCMNAGIYCRISEDREGAGLGVQRQREDCETIAQTRGWDVAHVYVDNDISAYSGKPRPEYRKLMEDIESGFLQAVVVWHLDRLHRQPKELEAFIDLVERKQVSLASVSGEHDLATPEGR